jgi:hypothetical protein
MYTKVKVINDDQFTKWYGGNWKPVKVETPKE